MTYSTTLYAVNTYAVSSFEAEGIVNVWIGGFGSGVKTTSDGAIAQVSISHPFDISSLVTGAAIAQVDVAAVGTDGFRWWKKEWMYRRSVNVYAMDQVPLPLGHPITIELDTDLVSSNRVRQDLHDLYVLYAGNPIVSEAEAKDGKTYIYCYAQEEIPAGQNRRYALYYGNPKSLDEFSETIHIS